MVDQNQNLVIAQQEDQKESWFRRTQKRAGRMAGKAVRDPDLMYNACSFFAKLADLWQEAKEDSAD